MSYVIILNAHPYWDVLTCCCFYIFAGTFVGVPALWPAKKSGWLGESNQASARHWRGRAGRSCQFLLIFCLSLVTFTFPDYSSHLLWQMLLVQLKVFKSRNNILRHNTMWLKNASDPSRWCLCKLSKLAFRATKRRTLGVVRGPKNVFGFDTLVKSFHWQMLLS